MSMYTWEERMGQINFLRLTRDDGARIIIRLDNIATISERMPNVKGDPMPGLTTIRLLHYDDYVIVKDSFDDITKALSLPKT